MQLFIGATSHTLSTLDWAVIALYALGMLAVGLYYSARSTETSDYLLGGRSMRPWAIGLSLFATLLSTVSYLSVPSEMIHRGPMILFGMLSYPLIILIVGWVLIPRVMRFNVTTAYELLETRLGLSARLTGASIFVVMRMLWMAVIIYATTDKVLVPLAGLDKSATPWVCAIMGGVTLVYTSMGGLRAVVWTDVLQTFILFLGALLCLGIISARMGGVSAWWPTTWAPHWETFRLLPDGSSQLSVLDMTLSTFTWYVCTSGSDQMAIQRYLATRDARAARRAYIFNMGLDVVVLLFCAMLGFALLSYFTANPQLLSPGQGLHRDADQLFPNFIVSGLPAGVTGLVVAGLLAAAMSSLSSGMSAVTSVVTVDFIDRFRAGTLSELQHLRVAKLVSLLVGIATVLLSLFYISKLVGNLLEVANRVVNLLTAPLFLLFFMAMFVPFATSAGAIAAAGVGTLSAAIVAYWPSLTGRPAFGFTWIMPVSLLAGAAAGVTVSSLSPRRPIAMTPEPEPALVKETR